MRAVVRGQAGPGLSDWSGDGTYMGHCAWPRVPITNTLDTGERNLEGEVETETDEEDAFLLFTKLFEELILLVLSLPTEIKNEMDRTNNHSLVKKHL